MTSLETSNLDGIVSLAEFERLAEERMDGAAFDYVAGGSEDERTLADNVAAFRRRRLLPRVLVDVSRIDTRARMLGRQVSLPIGVSPVAAQALAHPDGELATARAAAAAGAMFCLSTASNHSLDEVAAATPGSPRWFQLYVNEDAGFTRALVGRAEAAGYEAIVLTVDLPVLGYREREKRRGWTLDAPLGNFVAGTSFRPDGPAGEASDAGVAGAEAAGADEKPGASPDGRARGGRASSGDGPVDVQRLLDQRHVGVTWDGLAPLRAWTSLPLVIKGILHPDDARLAVEHGAAAIVVSNHGGRQMDRAPASLDALEAIVHAVDGRAEVYLDGGVRRGSDALIAIALGATAVFTGRPFVFALGAAGEAGVHRAFTILREELERGMALLGTPSLADVRREHVLP